MKPPSTKMRDAITAPPTLSRHYRTLDTNTRRPTLKRTANDRDADRANDFL